MCKICRKEYDANTTSIYCCENVKKIPKTLIKLDTLNCQYSQIKKIPKTLINLEQLSCQYSQIKKIPITLINLKRIGCCYNTQIKFIPDTIKDLEYLYCYGDVLVSPQTYKLKSNNKRYLTFTRCQVRYKLKMRLKNLKFAYDPKYIIGHNTKKQLERLFQN
jgi:hypothetical protein